jgi:uncharacterized protein (TIGR02722 family)
MKKMFCLFAVSCGALFFSGCATVSYGDAQSAKPINTEFGASDLQQVSTVMVDSLLSFPPMTELTSQRRPVIVVDRVKNKTSQHIDTESITDQIRTQLIRSGQYRFIDRTTDKQTLEEMQIQNGSGLVDQSKAVEMGKQYGAEYMLTSNISEITQTNRSVRDVYYKITMNLKNLKTGILEWSDEKEIRKVMKKGLFGE